MGREVEGQRGALGDARRAGHLEVRSQEHGRGGRGKLERNRAQAVLLSRGPCGALARRGGGQEQSRGGPKERVWAIRRATTPVKIDGELGEFASEAPAQMVAEANRQAMVRLLYDDQCLYLTADVQDDSPWKNAGGDATALFKTGDELSLWIGPSAGKRPPGVGDVRLLFAPSAGRVVVMAYRPKVVQGAKPVTFRSPSGMVTMDKVEELSDVRTAVKVFEKGYRLAAAIPWSAIGLSPGVERFGLDLSVDFSDPAGQRNVARLHWGRNGAAIVYDLPTEARFEPESWGVGVLAR